jgi:hypothetical protein
LPERRQVIELIIRREVTEYRIGNYSGASLGIGGAP